MMNTVTTTSLIVFKRALFLHFRVKEEMSAFVSSGVYCCSLFLSMAGPRCVSFPLSPAGLCSLSSEALVRCGGKSAPSRSNTHWWRGPSLTGPLLPTPQVTTLVTTVFLVVKVILSNVSDPHSTLSPSISPYHFDLWVDLDGRLGALLVIFAMSCSFRTTRPPTLKICCPRMHLATCYRSPRLWWPGWRPGSSTLRCSLKKLTMTEVRAALLVDLNMEKKIPQC